MLLGSLTKKITSYGYVKIRKSEHPFKDCDGFVFEHRLVAEKYLLTDKNSITINGKRYLKPEYDVHHKDENKLNNSKDNLQIMTRSEHISYHSKKRKKINNNWHPLKNKSGELLGTLEIGNQQPRS